MVVWVGEVPEISHGCAVDVRGPADGRIRGLSLGRGGVYSDVGVLLRAMPCPVTVRLASDIEHLDIVVWRLIIPRVERCTLQRFGGGAVEQAAAVEELHGFDHPHGRGDLLKRLTLPLNLGKDFLLCRLFARFLILAWKH